MTQPENTLQCINLSKHFGGIAATEGLSATFAPGKITALIGPNGAGKTTLFHLISGFQRPDSGEVRLGDRVISGLPPWRVARLGVGRLFQDTRIFPTLTVLQNVLLGIRRDGLDSVFRSFRWREKSSEAQQARDAARTILRSLDMEQLANQPAGGLSYGQQKLVALGRLIAADPAVVLLDEPASGVSPHLFPTLAARFRQFAKSGKTVILIEHNMSMVLDTADAVYFLDNGQVAYFGIPADVLAEPSVRKAYLGL